MVSFSCDQCADVVKKPQLDNHKERCRNNTFTCLDCNTTFDGTKYKSHISCISEKEKYQKGTLKGNKKKQDNSPEKSKQTLATSKQKQNAENSDGLGQELTPKKKKDALNKKNKDANNKKEQDVTPKKDLNKSQEQTSVSDIKQLEVKGDNKILNSPKKNKSKKKNATSNDTHSEVKEERKDKVENRTESEGTAAVERPGKEIETEKVSKKRKAEEQINLEKNKQPEAQVKNSSIKKVEEDNVQVSKKKKLESQHLTQTDLGNEVKPHELPTKAQILGDQSAGKKKTNSKKKKKVAESTSNDEGETPSGSQKASKTSDPDLSLSKADKSLKRKVEQQVVESSSSKKEKKQKTQAAEVSSEKQNNDANGKKKKKKKNPGAGKDNENAKNDALSFKFSATEIVKNIFIEGKHQEVTLQQLEKMVVDQLTTDPQNTLNSNELHQKFKENVTFVFKDGSVTLK